MRKKAQRLSPRRRAVPDRAPQPTHQANAGDKAAASAGPAFTLGAALREGDRLRAGNRRNWCNWRFAVLSAGEYLAIAVGTPITGRPPLRTVRAAFLHTAPTSDD